MVKKIKTMDIKGNEYAKVEERIKEFRADHPRALIETVPRSEGGQTLFKARILLDKANPNSAEATGHSLGKISGEAVKAKAFEKLETIAVGRALAFLGYSKDGEIATGEEMEEFEEDKKLKAQKIVDEAGKKLKACKSIEELKKVWSALSQDLKVATKKIASETKKKFKPVEKK